MTALFGNIYNLYATLTNNNNNNNNTSNINNANNNNNNNKCYKILKNKGKIQFIKYGNNKNINKINSNI